MGIDTRTRIRENAWTRNFSAFLGEEPTSGAYLELEDGKLALKRSGTKVMSMCGYQLLLDCVVRRLAGPLRHLARNEGYLVCDDKKWLADECPGVSAVAVGYFIHGGCRCYERFRPSTGRQVDYEQALRRCEREHGVPLEGPLSLAGLELPLDIQAEYLGVPLRAEVDAQYRIAFGGKKWDTLADAARAARERVVGRFKWTECHRFWEIEVGKTWRRIDDRKLKKLRRLPLPAQLRGTVFSEAPGDSPILPLEVQGTLGDDLKIRCSVLGGREFTSLLKAAIDVREYHTHEPENTDGWYFWKYREKDVLAPLDTLRRRFWDECLASPNPRAFWRSHLPRHRELDDSLYRAVVGGNPCEQRARAFSRTISFPFIGMPDDVHLEAGLCLGCLAGHYKLMELKDVGRFLDTLWTSTTGFPFGDLNNLLINELSENPALADAMRRYDRSACVTAAADVVAALQRVLGRTDLLDIVLPPGWGLAAASNFRNWAICFDDFDGALLGHACCLLDLAGVPNANDSFLRWLNLLILSTAFRRSIPAPKFFDNGCGEAWKELSCDSCGGDGIRLMPRLVPTFRVFTKNSARQVGACCCAVCQNHWIPFQADNRNEQCPRCAGKRKSKLIKIWQRVHREPLPPQF